MVAKKTKTLLLISAWIAILSVSDLPSVIWFSFLNKQDFSYWIPFSQFLGIGLALAMTFISEELHPVRGFIWALLAFIMGEWISFGLQSTDTWTSFTYSISADKKMLMRVFLSLIPCVLMTLTLSGSGIGRKELFLRRGDLKAPGSIPFRSRPVSWAVIGPSLLIIFTLPLILQLALTLHPDFSMGKKVMAAMPVILAFSVINAATEEFRFRSVLIARLRPVVGQWHVLLLCAALFGIGHWFGHPSGLSGMLLTGFASVVWGKSMIDTKGFFWPWLIHMVQDVAIVSMIVMTAA